MSSGERWAPSNLHKEQVGEALCQSLASSLTLFIITATWEHPLSPSLPSAASSPVPWPIPWPRETVLSAVGCLELQDAAPPMLWELQMLIASFVCGPLQLPFSVLQDKLIPFYSAERTPKDRDDFLDMCHTSGLGAKCCFIPVVYIWSSSFPWTWCD
jgi:hypothetical protein